MVQSCKGCHLEHQAVKLSSDVLEQEVYVMSTVAQYGVVFDSSAAEVLDPRADQTELTPSACAGTIIRATGRSTRSCCGISLGTGKYDLVHPLGTSLHRTELRT